MPANDTMTLAQLKDYVRKNKLNKPEVKLSMNKAQLTAGLKKHGHWESGTAKGGPKSLRAKPVARRGHLLLERAKKMKADREK